MRAMKKLINSSNVCFRMLVVVKSEYSHKVTKIEVSQGVSLVDNTIFDQMLSHFCEYSLFIRVLVFEYSYERIWKSIRILFVVRSFAQYFSSSARYIGCYPRLTTV